jgi:hypothetical protein
MSRKIQKFWIEHRQRVSQYNIEFYHYWLQRLDGPCGTAASVPGIVPPEIHGHALAAHSWR